MKALVVVIVCALLGGCGIGPWKKGRGTTLDTNEKWDTSDHRDRKRL